MLIFSLLARDHSSIGVKKCRQFDVVQFALILGFSSSEMSLYASELNIAIGMSHLCQKFEPLVTKHRATSAIGRARTFDPLQRFEERSLQGEVVMVGFPARQAPSCRFLPNNMTTEAPCQDLKLQRNFNEIGICLIIFEYGGQFLPPMQSFLPPFANKCTTLCGASYHFLKNG